MLIWSGKLKKFFFIVDMKLAVAQIFVVSYS